MTTVTIDENAPILIEFPPKAGIQQVSLSLEDLGDKSAKAFESAMKTIQQMGQRVTTAVKSMAQKPSEVEVSFGLKFDVESGVLIAKAGMEAGLNVKLKWELKKDV